MMRENVTDSDNTMQGAFSSSHTAFTIETATRDLFSSQGS
jgi:hypothetical protein